MARLRGPSGDGTNGLQGGTGRSALRDSAQIILAAFAAGLVLKVFVLDACRIETGSMEPALLPGDFLLVNKLVYGARATIPFLNPASASFSLPGLTVPQAGDVLVFRHGGEGTLPPALFVKRCIGGPHDTVEVAGGAVLVNRRRLLLVGREGPPGAGREEAFGPVVVPWRGMKLQLRVSMLESWRNLIEGEGHFVGASGEEVEIDGKPASTYEVQHQYFFVMGDSRNNSVDSRTFGPVPEDCIVGKAVMVYWSRRDIEPGASFWRRCAALRWDRLGTIVR